MADRIPYTSPEGEAYYPSLNTTEKYKGKDTGNYVCKLVLAGEALESAKAVIDAFLIEVYGPKKAAKVWKDRSPIKTTSDGEKSYVTFLMSAVVRKTQEARRVMIYDSRGNLVKRKLHIGNGSIIRIQGAIAAFSDDDPGVAFYMRSIQVIKYVEFIPKVFAPDGDGDFVANEPPDNEAPDYDGQLAVFDPV
jgi:hypothetical protein